MSELKQTEKIVAWMRPSKDGYDANYRDARAVAISKLSGATHWEKSGWIPLCEMHPQSPLTEEEIKSALGLSHLPSAHVVRDVRMIELAHRIM